MNHQHVVIVNGVERKLYYYIIIGYYNKSKTLHLPSEQLNQKKKKNVYLFES